MKAALFPDIPVVQGTEQEISVRYYRLIRAAPAGLVALRCALALLLIGDASDGRVSGWFLPGVLAGFLSDVFDGVLARRLGVSTARLRQADSWADLLFYGCIACSAWLGYRDLLVPFTMPLLVFFATYAAWWVVNLSKYGRPACYHTYLARIWGCGLLVAIVSLFGFDYAGITLAAAIVLGILNCAEDMLITCLLPHWTHDVPTLLHALRLQRVEGKPTPSQIETQDLIDGTIEAR